MRTTVNFGSDNIYYVPEGEPLAIYDIYNWRIIELYIDELRVYQNERHLPIIKEALRQEAEQLIKKHRDLNPKLLQLQIEDFLSGFEIRDLPPADLSDVQFLGKDLFFPQTAALWLRISDVPLETFYDEDYRELPMYGSVEEEILVPINASLYLDCLDEYEKSLPLDNELSTPPFAVGFEEDTIVVIKELSPFSFLPMIDEYCGAFGSSGRGILMNYTHHSSISEENLAAIPLYSQGDTHFVTLYFSLITNSTQEIIYRFTEKQYDTALEKLIEQGFKVVKEFGDNYIIRRGDDIVHLYGAAIDKESLAGERFLPPFMLVTANDANVNPDERSRLLSTLIELFQ